MHKKLCMSFVFQLIYECYPVSFMFHTTDLTEMILTPHSCQHVVSTVVKEMGKCYTNACG